MAMRAVRAITAALLATGAAAQQAPRTMQQDYDAATALDAGKDHGAALAAWAALEARAKPGSRTRAIAIVRKGGALFRLARYDEAADAVRAGVAGLPATDPTLVEDRSIAFRIMGQVAANTLDYAGAASAYAKVEAIAATPEEKALPLLRLIETLTFTDPSAAQAALARAAALPATVMADKRVAAAFARARTLLLLNTGDLRGARTSALNAVSLLGGLTEKTDVLDASARSDAAIAFLLEGNADEARRYMAYSGAGRMAKGEFDPASDMRAPDCGGEAGLKPDDVAVVEFTIAPDGSVMRAAPIYAAGGGQVGLEFARAARGWSWPAETVAAMPTFFRYNARVEMRCSTAFARPSIGDGMDAELESWLAGKGVAIAPAPETGLAAAAVRQRAALASAASGLPTLAAAYRLASNAVLPREERAALYARAAALAGEAPPLARLAVALPARTLTVEDIWKSGRYDVVLRGFLADPAYARDARARSAIRLMIADAGDQGKTRDRGRTAASLTELRQVAEDKELPSNDPLRVGALVRIASIEERTGSPAAARATFAASGLAANQCAILDAPPKATFMPGSEAFPMEAARWGFEGWAQVQYDIAADGRTANQRALLSYPPFVFTKASTTFFAGTRYAKTFRPDGGLGCGGTATRIRFMLPS
jgi:hypothetical protein